MTKLPRGISVLVATYVVAWTVAYVLVMGLDFAYFLEYFVLAWTFSGLEVPTYIWLFSIAVFLPFAGLALFLLRRRRGVDLSGR
jgi:hypothetical protein